MNTDHSPGCRRPEPELCAAWGGSCCPGCMPDWAWGRSWPAEGASWSDGGAVSTGKWGGKCIQPHLTIILIGRRLFLLCFKKNYWICLQSYLEAIEICVEDISTLDICHQTHRQLLIVLVSDVHGGGDIYRKSVHPWKYKTRKDNIMWKEKENRNLLPWAQNWQLMAE